MQHAYFPGYLCLPWFLCYGDSLAINSRYQHHVYMALAWCKWSYVLEKKKHLSPHYDLEVGELKSVRLYQRLIIHPGEHEYRGWISGCNSTMH